MKRRSSILFIGLIAIGYLFSCTKRNAETLAPGSCSGTPGPLFTNVRAVLQNNCALSGCHAGTTPQNGINFTDNCTIVAQKSQIKLRAVDQAGTASQMPPPPNPTLSVTDRQKIT